MSADWEQVAEKISDALSGEQNRRGGWTTLCPAHDDHQPSLDLDIKDDTLLFKCRVGCEQDAILDALRALDLWPKRPENEHGRITDADNRVATYEYRGLDGKLLAYKDRFEVVRDGKRRKSFQWRTDTGPGLPDNVEPLVYRAERVQKDQSATVVVVEGEKVVHNLEIVAAPGPYIFVSPPNGADAKWTPEQAEVLRGRTVVILPDEDDAGYSQLAKALRGLEGVAKSVSWVKLPGIGPKQDAVDWFAAGHTVDEFRAALSQSKHEVVAEDLPKPEGKLPHNLEAERVVLGAIMLRQQEAYEAVRLSPTDFYPRGHQALYAAYIDLYEQGKPLGKHTVIDYFSSRDRLKDVGGQAYLAKLEDAGRTNYSDYLEEQAELIRKAATQRALIEAGESIVGIGWDGKLDPQDAVQHAFEQVSSVTTQRGATDFTDMPTLMEIVSDRMDVLAEQEGRFTGLVTGYSALDFMTGGLQAGDLAIVAARPSHGKTAIALNMVHYIAKHTSQPIAIFSVEMSQEQIGQRLLILESSVDGNAIRVGKLSHSEAKAVQAGLENLAKRPIYVDDRSTTILEMKARAKRLQREKGLSLLIVDYIQLMSGSERARRFGDVSEVTEISKGLKGIARELGVVVLALSQLSREPEKRKDQRPIMSDLRSSGAIEQDADVIMGLYRDEVVNRESTDRGVAELEVLKHRNGPTGVVHLAFNHALMMFSTLDYRGDYGIDEEGVA